MNCITKNILLSCATVGLFLAGASTASAATITVNTTTDELDAGYATDCNPGSESDCSLREAIELSNENVEDDTIILPTGTITIGIDGNDEDANATGDFDISEAETTVTITGAGMDASILDGAGLDRVLDVSDTGLILNDVTIQNGDAYIDPYRDNGGGVRVDIDLAYTDLAVEFNSVNLNHNNAYYGGGAYVYLYAPFTMEDSVVETNTTSGSVDHAAGIKITSIGDSASTITNSQFIDNTGAKYAGAIYNDGGSMYITASFFSGNTADFGGVYYSYRNYDEVYITNILAINNGDRVISHRTAAGGAGGTYGLVTVAHSTIVSTEDDTYALHLGGDDDDTAVMDVQNSIIIGFGVSCVEGGSTDTISSNGYNIVDTTDCGFESTGDMQDTDPLVDSSVADKGGDFDVLGLQASSPAIDAIPLGSCMAADGETNTADIRGMNRFNEDDTCDIGAYELDQTDPEVSVTAGDDTVECSIDTWTDAGATASDEFDTTVATASTEDAVDEATLGEQLVAYVSEADYDGNTGSANRTVTVVDTTNPAISLSGSSTVTLTEGDTYTDAGATASDACDGTLTDDIEVVSTVNTATAGTYTVTYSVADSSGNEAEEVVRTVTVEVAEEEEDDSGDNSDDSDDSSDDDTDNDAESGEGDGSDDTEETLGVVESLTRLSNNTVQVTYENGSTKTFQLFPNGSAKAKVQLHTNGNILIAINKKFIRTYDAFTGDRLYSKKLFKKKQYKTKFKRYNVYKNAPGKNNIMVLAQTKKKHKKQFKLKAFVVQAGGKIVVRNTQSVTTNKNTAISKLNTKKNNKSGKKARIIVTRKGKNLADHKYKVTKKKGRIVLAQ